MSKFKTVYGFYYVNPQYNHGFSMFYENRRAAEIRLEILDPSWQGRIETQTYELEEDQSHDCGDDE